MRGHTKHRHNLSHYFIACRCHLGLRIQFTPASKETGGIFEKIVAGVTGLEPATSCVTGRRSNQLSYTPGKGRENVAEVFSRSSGSAKKMIRTTDAKEVGVGNTTEETYRCPNQRAMFLFPPCYVNTQILQLNIRKIFSYFLIKNGCLPKMAEREGFEPSLPLRVITLSRRAPSTTQPPLRRAGAHCV